MKSIALLSSALRSLTGRRRRGVAAITALAVAMGAVGSAALADPSDNDDAEVDTSQWATAAAPLAPARSLLANDDLTVGVRMPHSVSDGQSDYNRNTILTANSAAASAKNDGVYTENTYSTAPAVGRFFNTTKDARVEIGNIVPNVGTYLTTTMVGIEPVNQSLPYTQGADTLARAAVADFDGDGYDELLLTYSDAKSQAAGNERARLLKAVDVNDPSKGFDMGTEIALNDAWGIRAVAAGDFEGDGRPELAVLVVNDALELWVQLYSVDGTNITYRAGVRIDSGIQSLGVDGPFDLRAGRFVNGSKDQLAVLYRGATNTIKLQMVDSGDDGVPKAMSAMDTNRNATLVKVVSGKFAWRDATDSMAVMLTTLNGEGSATSSVWLIKVGPTDADPTLSPYIMTAAWTIDPDSFFSSYTGDPQSRAVMDIALGNFDNQTPSPTGIGTVRNPDSQLALALAQPAGNGLISPEGVGIVDIMSSTTQAISPTIRPPVIKLPNAPYGATGMVLGVGDLQGRSYRLGKGYRVEIDRMSPVAILAQPPSHADYATAVGQGAPSLVNVSLSPAKLNAKYTEDTNSSVAYSNTTTKGWGFSGKESVGGDVKLNAGIGSMNVSETFTAEQDLNHSTDTKYGSEIGLDSSFSMTTGTGDALKLQDGFSYVYVYDLIGQTVCPASIPSCSADQQVPATVMFSAPGDIVVSSVGDGSLLPWYQPVWENGNVLSYPSSASQLLYSPGDPSGQRKQVTTPLQVSLGSSAVDNRAGWSHTGSTESTVSFSKTFKEDSATSISGSVGFEELADVSANVSLDFGGSDAFANVRTTSTTFGTKSGMDIHKDGFSDTTINYDLTAYVFGDQRLASYADGTDPNPDAQTGSGGASTALDVLGPLRSGYTVNLGGTGAGSFWKRNYTAAPDIALNHPARWTTDQWPATNPLPSNCLEFGNTAMECASLTLRPDPTTMVDPWSDTFHQMRGFFIVKAADANPNDPNNPGAQQVNATAGDPMKLMTRVYNYSLKDTGDASIVVNFFATVMDTTTDLPVTQPDGSDSIFIGQAIVNQKIPGAGNGNQNYLLASLDFDTTPYAGKDLAFWVEAHGQHPDGTLLDELAGKGISKDVIQGYTSYKQALGMEPTVTDTWSKTGGTTTFSNNIGFYRQIFHVDGGTNVDGGANLAEAAPPKGNVKSVAVRDVTPKKLNAAKGEPIEVSAMLHNGGPAIKTPKLYFYDGDPAKGGTLFGVEYLAHVDAGADHIARVQYKPTTCGDHDIYVKASHHGMLGLSTKAIDTVHVACDGEPPLPNNLTPDGGGCNCSTTPGSVSGSDLAGAAALALVTVPFLRRRKRTA